MEPLLTRLKSDQLWLVGGCEDTSYSAFAAETQVYDPRSDQWEPGPELTEGLSSACLVPLDAT